MDQLLAKTDNAKYVKCKRSLVIKHDEPGGDDIEQGNCDKVDAPFKYTDVMIMLAASLRAAWSIRTDSSVGL